MFHDDLCYCYRPVCCMWLNVLLLLLWINSPNMKRMNEQFTTFKSIKYSYCLHVCDFKCCLVLTNEWTSNIIICNKNNNDDKEKKAHRKTTIKCENKIKKKWEEKISKSNQMQSYLYALSKYHKHWHDLQMGWYRSQTLSHPLIKNKYPLHLKNFQHSRFFFSRAQKESGESERRQKNEGKLSFGLR